MSGEQFLLSILRKRNVRLDGFAAAKNIVWVQIVFLCLFKESWKRISKVFFSIVVSLLSASSSSSSASHLCVFCVHSTLSDVRSRDTLHLASTNSWDTSTAPSVSPWQTSLISCDIETFFCSEWSKCHTWLLVVCFIFRGNPITSSTSSRSFLFCLFVLSDSPSRSPSIVIWSTESAATAREWMVRKLSWKNTREIHRNNAETIHFFLVARRSRSEGTNMIIFRVQWGRQWVVFSDEIVDSIQKFSVRAVQPLMTFLQFRVNHSFTRIFDMNGTLLLCAVERALLSLTKTRFLNSLLTFLVVICSQTGSQWTRSVTSHL